MTADCKTNGLSLTLPITLGDASLQVWVSAGWLRQVPIKWGSQHSQLKDEILYTIHSLSAMLETYSAHLISRIKPAT